MTYVPGLKTVNSTTTTIVGAEISGNLVISGNTNLGNDIADRINVRSPTRAVTNITINYPMQVTGDVKVAGSTALETVSANEVVIVSGANFSSLNMANIIYTSSISFTTRDGYANVARQKTLQTFSTNRNGMYYLKSTIIARQEKAIGAAEPYYVSDNVNNTLFGLAGCFTDSGYYFAGQSPAGLDSLKGQVYLHQVDNKRFTRISASNASLTLTGSISRVDDMFGNSVFSKGDLLFVGSLDCRIVNNTASGGVFIFRSSSISGWKEEQVLLSTTPGRNYYGREVKYYDDTLYIGETGVTSINDSVTGSVYLFNSSSSGWVLQTILSQVSKGYGYRIKKAQNKIAIGSPFEGPSNAYSGAIYIYDSSSNGIVLEQKITSPTPSTNRTSYGSEFEFSGNYLFVAAPSERTNRTGQIYLYQSSSNGWNIVQTITSSGAVSTDTNFGAVFELSGNELLTTALKPLRILKYQSSSLGWYPTSVNSKQYELNIREVLSTATSLTCLKISGNYMVIAGNPGISETFFYPHKYNTADGWFPFGDSQMSVIELQAVITNNEGKLKILTQSNANIMLEDSGCTATYAVSGTDILLNITGSTNQNIMTWKVMTQIKSTLLTTV